MSVIYEPKGKAREYSPLACNLYKGCAHGCIYCYAPSATYTNRETFSNNPQPRKKILQQLKKDASKFTADPRSILLCFTTDPYQPIEADLKLTRQALQILTNYRCTVQVLTKGGLLAIRDFDLLTQNPKNAFSVTLTTDDPIESLQWEPQAALPKDRIKSLQIAKRAGLNTWVSFEPVYNPEAVFRLIDRTHTFVDLYKVGKMNYHPIAREIDWPTFRDRVINKLENLQKPYYIKKDLMNA